MHFGIKLPYRLRYAVIAVLLCAVIGGLSLFVLRTEAHAPYDSTRENFAVFLSKGMEPSKANIGEIPPAFEEIRVWLEERRQGEGFFRTAWLPGERVLAFKILIRYDPTTFKGTEELDHTLLVLLPLLREGTADVGKLLAYYNVKYIIVSFYKPKHETWQPYYEGPPRLLLQEPYGFGSAGDAGEYVKLLDRQRDLKLVVDKPEYRIYENLDFTIPHISAYNRIFLLAPPGLTRGLPLEGETSAIQRPVENWDYFYGYPRSQETYPTQYLQGFTGAADEFPFEYMHGQTLATIPGLLSKIPSFNPSQHLLVFDEFLPSDEAREEYLKLADAVIFLGDVDSSEEAKKWTEEPESLLFVHEAESCLTFTPDKPPEETEIDPIEIADDNQTAFWQGKGALQLSNEMREKVSGADSLKITVDEGNVKRWHLEHDYTTPQDWSGKDFISLYWYGGNTGATFRLIPLDSWEPLNYFCYYFTDDFSGWERIKIPLGNFTTVGEPDWDNITFLQISVMEENTSGTWYLDRVIADVNPPAWIATVIGSTEETDPTVIADENQAAFWEGKGAIQLSNETREGVNGADSLKITVNKGNVQRWHLEHDYTTPQDWSEKDFISLNWYGGNTGATFRLIPLDSWEPLNYFAYYFVDDFSGWRRIIIPLSDFLTMGKPSWDNITLLQISVMDENTSGTWYLDRVVVDVNPSPAIGGTLWSYDHALAIDGEGQLAKTFFAPRANYFRFMIRAAVDGEISLKINDQPLNITDIYESEDSLKWYESSPIYLETGDHILSIDFTGNEATFDQILILSTKREDTAFKDIFSTDQLEIDWVEKRPSEYSVQINSDDPPFIVLGEAYHAEWQASASDGKNLKHIPAFPLGWANGFYLPEGGEQQVEIIFGMQETKDIAIRVWMIAWGCLIAAILGIWILYYRRRLRR